MLDTRTPTPRKMIPNAIDLCRLFTGITPFFRPTGTRVGIAGLRHGFAVKPSAILPLTSICAAYA